MPARAESFGRHAARSILVLRDIQPDEPRREFQRREMVGRQRRNHGHPGQDGFQRQDGLDSLAGEEDAPSYAEAHAIAEETPERAALIELRAPSRGGSDRARCGERR